MPTVPRQEGRRVLAEPMPGARVSVSADEETFGGGAANKAVTTAMEQLNTTVQNNRARQIKLNSSLKTNKLISMATQEALSAHFDSTPEDFDTGEIDPVTKKPVTVNMPKGILLASGKNASVGGGQQKRSFDTTMKIADKYVAMTDSPEEADRLITAYSKTAQSLNDRAGSSEIAQMNAYHDEELDSGLNVIASNQALSTDQKIQQISDLATTNGALMGKPKSYAEEKIVKASYLAYESELQGMLNSRVASEKDVSSLIKRAEEKDNLPPEYIFKLNKMIETDKAKATIAMGEAKIKAEETVTTTPLTMENDFRMPWAAQTQRVKKIQQKGMITEREFQSKVLSADKKSAQLALAKTDNPTFTELMMKMVAPGYADDKKRLDHISAYEEAKLAPADYNVLGALYAMKPEEKHNASMGLKGFDEKAKNNPNITPDEKRQVFEMYMKEVPKINDKYTQTDAFDKVNLEFNKLAGIARPDDTVDTMANNALKMNGNSVHIQSTGKSKSPTGKANVTLAPQNQPVSKYKDHPRYAQAVAILKQHRKKVSDKNLKVVLGGD